MGNSMSLQGQPAAAGSATQDAEALHGPARLPLALKHPATADTSAATLPNTPSSHIPASSTTKQDVLNFAALQQARSLNGEGHAAHNAAPSSSSSSYTSSIASLSSRGFTNDDTMPWRGSPHGSHGSMPDLVDAKSDKSEGHGECCHTFGHGSAAETCYLSNSSSNSSMYDGL
jgi:hypothetical protein